MFTGIIESMGQLVALEKEGTNLDMTFSCNFVDELKIDQSLAHNGVCLTVVQIDLEKKTYVVTAIKESLDRSNLGDLKIGDKVNLERCTKIGSRLDGHIVQGHVDQVGKCTKIENINGSWDIYFEYEKSQFVTVEKGSITINGISLTVVNSGDASFSVSIIPYTFEETNFCDLKVGDKVNLEFDIVGKYIQKLMP